MYFQKYLLLLPVLASTISCGPIAAARQDESYKLKIKTSGLEKRVQDKSYKLKIKIKGNPLALDKRDEQPQSDLDKDSEVTIEYPSKRDAEETEEMRKRSFDVNKLPPAVRSKLLALGFDGTKGDWTVEGV